MDGTVLCLVVVVGALLVLVIPLVLKTAEASRHGNLNLPRIRLHDRLHSRRDGRLHDAAKDRDRGREVEPFVSHVFFYGNKNGDDGTVVVPINIKHVFAVELVRAWIPRGEHQIHVGNNWLDLTVMPSADASTPSTYSVQLEMGDGWTAQATITRLQSLIRAIGDPALAAFTASFQVRRSQLQLSNATPFTLLFGTGPHAAESLAAPLGFPREDVVGVENATTSMYEAKGQRMDYSGARHLHVTSQELQDQHTDGVIAQIAMSPLAPIVTWKNTDDIRSFARPKHITSLTLRFTTFDENRASRRATARHLVESRREQARSVIAAIDATTTQKVDVQLPGPDEGTTAWDALDDNERLAYQRAREQELLRAFVATHYEDTQLDPYRPYDFNGLYYNITIAVHSYRFKVPIENHFDRLE